jgi:cell wall assembly regulator SMI1
MKFSDSFSPASEEEISNFERLIGYTLPEDYRKFLSEHNGGRQPALSVFRIESGQESILALLFAVGDRDSFADLERAYTSDSDFFPRGVIPIGGDICGNHICLAVTGDDRGTIYWVDHEISPEPSDPMDNLFFCARSFSEFIGSLKEDDRF